MCVFHVPWCAGLHIHQCEELVSLCVCFVCLSVRDFLCTCVRNRSSAHLMWCTHSLEKDLSVKEVQGLCESDHMDTTYVPDSAVFS